MFIQTQSQSLSTNSIFSLKVHSLEDVDPLNDVYAFCFLQVLWVNQSSAGRSGSVPPQCWVTVGGVGAVVVADARVDHHHGSFQQSAGGALEAHLGRGGLVRRAAARVAALAAVPQLVGAGAVAALVNEANGARRRVAGLTSPLLTPLVKQHTQSELQ